ncbi:MAG TPA: UDPGP type 1 family protein [Tepidisphaeraceae bacterium]|nr:UDPGP type 1 family protein [Tepidisphaeraceae bacterium]
MDSTALRDRLKQVRQDQVLRFAEELDPTGKQKLTKQLEAQQLEAMPGLVAEYVTSKPHVAVPADIKPVQAYPYRPDAQRRQLYADARKRGEELLRAGKVACFLVAGGQGTRLGYDGPKGEFPVTPIRNKPLFQVFAEGILAASRDYGRPVPWYVMTSETNDAATRAFFQKHNHFGLDPRNVTFFVQGMMPAFGMDGRMLLESKDSLALSADGHGGSLRALKRTGALDDMAKRGVEHLSYFQVDNALVHVVDPLFVGLHDLTGSEMSSKGLPKANALEKVGNFVVGDGKLQVIEYSDLPESLAVQTNPDGGLKFNVGSIGIHALRVGFIEQLNAGGQLKLPWHRAEKKVPHVDEQGRELKPDKPNAVKLEQFVFDAIPLAKNAIVYMTERAEEFSPVKNAEGVDSPATSRRDQVRRAARWLREAGVDVPEQNGEPAATLEISPLLARNAEQLQARNLSGTTVRAGEKIYFGENGPERA